ncbi:MAG: MerR family transcriptional regulator [bacterium]|nr:MerR family transcriptional regulator [bacterium]
MYTVKQLAELADVSVRTLHYYDEIALLRPSRVGANGYRYYDDEALLRLQQILFYREIGLELMQIREIVDSPDFDLVAALRSHRIVIQEKMNRLQHLIGTIDHTIQHLAGENTMSKKRLFEGFSEEKQKEYEREARLQYGPEHVNESVRRWNGYGKERQQAIMEEGGDIYLALSSAMQAGKPANDEDVQKLVSRWHEHIRHFYEPTLDILRGLGELYNTHPEFMAFFQRIHADLPAYLQETITQYVDDLEYAEIERMLAEDEALRLRE